MKRQIRDEEDFKKVVREAGELIQAIEKYLDPMASAPVAKISFPYGFIRSANVHRNRLPFVRNTALQSNMAYTLMLSDTLNWLLFRTDISGTAAEMLRKLQLFLAGSLVESITKDYLTGRCAKGFKHRTQWLVDHHVIGTPLKLDLDWLWDARNKMHLFLINDAEYINEYTKENHKRAASAFQQLIAALSQRKRQ